MVDRTYYYNDEAQLTYKERWSYHIFTDLENYNSYYRIPQNYGPYVPLVHAVCYGNINGDIMVRFSTITTSVHLWTLLTTLLTTKLLLCFGTENPDGLCASSDVAKRSR